MKFRLFFSAGSAALFPVSVMMVKVYASAGKNTHSFFDIRGKVSENIIFFQTGVRMLAGDAAALPNKILIFT